tara:strand:- start:2521 stop:2988 length:468 start_codon:yes stop_codon:yes gene_type:complete
LGKGKIIKMAQLNILRTAAGIKDMDHFRSVMGRRTIDYNGKQACAITTRRTPTRKDEILKSGGSIFWICQRMIQARQKIVGFELEHDEQGKSHCIIMLDPQIILTNPRGKKPVQGWRYLKEEDAPKDLGGANDGDVDLSELPSKMVRELKKLGLL